MNANQFPHPGPAPGKPLNGGIIGWFAGNPVAANLLLIAVIAMGLLSLSSIRKEAFPSLEPDYVRVSVVYDGGTPAMAEEGIALKIEEALESVPGIKRITSTSNAKGSSVNIEKTSDYDLDVLLADIKNQVDAINNFPAEAEKPVISKARRQDHAAWIQLYGDAEHATLQALAERLKAELLARPAISELSLSGKAEPIIAIEVDEATLQAYGLTLADIASAINAESASALTTSLRNEQKVLRLTASEQAYNRDQFRNITLLSGTDGSVVRLGDVASVIETFDDDSFVLSRYNGQNGIGIQLLMDENGDITRIVDEAQQVVQEWQQGGMLPSDVQLQVWYDKSTTIKDRLALLTGNAITGIAMVFIVLALFLNVRVALWVAAGLPFVFFGTLYFMTDRFTGLTINQMTTFGFIMALGIVVDDAVVVGESIYSTRRAHGDSLANTVRGTLKVAVPTVFGVLTTVAAFMALSNVDGNLGKIYAQFGTVVTICLLLSMVESKLILPAHLAHINTRRSESSGQNGWRTLWPRIQQGADRGLQWFNQRLYRPAVETALRLRYAVVLGFLTLLILVAGLPFTGGVRVSFFPDIPGDVVSASLDMQTDASFGQTHANLLRLEQAAWQADQQLRGPDSADPSAITGLQLVAEDDLSGAITVELSGDAPYSSSEFSKLWQQLIGAPEGVRQLQVRASRVMVDNFKVELKSWDSATVLAAGKQLKAALSQTPGVSGIDDNMSPGQPQLRFELTEQGRALGLDTAMLSEQILQAFGGSFVQKFQRDKDEVEVRVSYPSAQRQTQADILQARIRLDDGRVLPLSSVANISAEFSETDITRIDGLRATYISAVVDKSVVSSNQLVAQLERDVLPQLQSQYHDLDVHFGGEAEEQAETTSSMAHMFLLTLLVIYALLAIPLRSYVQPLLIMTAIPFGVVGAILGHWWNDLTISILSLNGVLALSGVVVNDSLLLVSSYNELKDGGMTTGEAIIEACTSRLRPVLLTSVTTFAGLAPLLYETSLQAQFLIPAAAALGYGILFATLITLILIPALLRIQADVQGLLAKPTLTVHTAADLVTTC
ncbi:efflux RND transporter permease subunit [Pseudomaricurvus alcaniphilus]|uniref:efflux RND transporter permease subunit n=1 Tax=Pseudomaricurvus alcaniphilus TaxID=1166482 RepID=UPI00140A7CA3|nr:efflux RND transporter permease subunit [Pseudomaricurvus alcaniphilus]NHN36649.1 efflux RND transporter permease subunit [Pseudomaricurvus alcaniphilus]